MTDREKAIVMAHTGTCMLVGDKFQIFHKYIEDIMGRPVMTHEIGWLEDEIKEKSKADFIALCADESGSENLNKWIPISERLPKPYQPILVTSNAFYWGKESGRYFVKQINFGGVVDFIAWMPLPEPYKGESEEVWEQKNFSF